MFNRSEIFRTAWANAKGTAEFFGGAGARARFPACLAAAWAKAKAVAQHEEQHGEAERAALVARRAAIAADPLAHLNPQLNPILRDRMTAYAGI